ncbi:hypothetical protein NLJ89_g8589 [Agrocybe chaxingu]|uniref:phosphatidylserine decarboxylase n=1 Tax=Agrocybe chaxingu TaxID=84603 RepID=A0A9W8MS11_9AGAR|nr:hypothetical protein NLJ89_g8589 [Agrocybe chaxingu]
MNVTKPVGKIHPGDLPEASHHIVARGFASLLERSADNHHAVHHIHAPIHSLSLEKLTWVQHFIPGFEKLAVEHHCGNFVVVRGTSVPFFESMPLYARLGMHLLFYGKEEIKVLGNRRVEELLREQSIKQGKIYDDPKSVHSIPSFVETYSIQLDELLEPDVGKYGCFNEFFFRKLKPDSRPIQNEDDPTVICSVADCRLTVYTSVDLAREFWIKGQNFTIPNLFNLPPSSPKVEPFHDDARLAIFRLGPADYHRFHSPIDCEVGEIEHVPGQFFTVNPQAVNEPGFDVFTANTRSILYLKHLSTSLPVVFVAICALLVGSIVWTGGKEKGATLKRGDELGYFAYGGSTIVVIFPKEIIDFDEDLVSNSEKPIETLVKAGYSIGRMPVRL